ncbi:CvpA family protein [Candidatus Uhrbacteria bacterium]|nr:CvpA family protein [Candidatus Uhrbacteria bacterium]
MMFLDLIILGLIAGFAIYGFSVGFVHTLSSLIGTVFSIIVAVHTHVTVAFWILPDIMAGQFWAQITVFFFILALGSKLVQILVEVIGKAFDVVSIIPFTKTINRILGVVVGLLEGVLIAGAALFVAISLPGLPESFQLALDNSVMASTVMFVAMMLGAIFPEASERASELINMNIPQGS